MRSTRAFFDPGERPFLLSFLVVLPLFILAHLGFHSYYHVNDDDWVLFFTKGVGLSLEPDAHIYTNNILLGYLLKFLYTHFQRPNWYTYCLLVAEFLSFWGFGAALLLSSHVRLKLLLFAVGFYFYDIYYCIELNYTMESALLAQTGIFLSILALQEDLSRFKTRLLVFSFICFLFSFLLRTESFYLALLTALPFLVFTLWGKPWSLKKSIPFLALAVLLALCQSWNQYSYAKDPGWKSFTQKILCFYRYYDWRDLSYTPQSKPYFDEIGWNENDVKLFQHYFFLDENKFNVKNLEELGKHLPLFSAHGKRGNYTSLWPILFGNPFSSSILICFLFFFLWCPPKKFLLLTMSFFWVLGLIVFLMYAARVVDRVFLPSLSFLANLALFYASPPRGLKKNPAGTYCLPSPRALGLVSILVLGMAIPTFFQHETWNDNHLLSDSFKKSLVDLNPKDDQLYVVWGSSLFHEYLDAFDDFEVYRHLHMFIIGSWSISPYGQKMLDHFAVKNLCREIVTRPDIFLICTFEDAAIFHQYLFETYGLNFRAKTVFQGCNFRVFHLYLAGDQPVEK